MEYKQTKCIDLNHRTIMRRNKGIAFVNIYNAKWHWLQYDFEY